MYSLTFGSFLWSAPVQDETAHHCFLYFIKLFYIFRALDCDQTIFWECASKNLTWSHLCKCMVCAARAPPAAAHCRRRKISLIRCKRFSRAWFHIARVKAEQRQSRGSTEAARTERNGGFGFQTKVKDRFLNQRRWTCWYSCRENMQVLSATDSLVLLFVFILKSLLSLLFTSRYTMEAFLIF